LSSSEPELHEFIQMLAKEIVKEMNRLVFRKHRERLKILTNNPEKLIYEHLLYNGPRSFTGLMYDLGIPKSTLDVKMRILKELRLVVIDEDFRYRVRPLENGNTGSPTNPSENSKV
jgi:DNA-binding transcriptional ArsR family regulator